MTKENYCDILRIKEVIIMDLFITTSDKFDTRLNRERIDKTFTATGETLNDILSSVGYPYFERGLYKTEIPSDEHILIRCEEKDFAAINAVLWNLPLEEYTNMFTENTDGVTKYTLQNYEQGQTAPRCIFLNDLTEY